MLAIVFSRADSVVVGVVLVTLSSGIASVLVQPFQAAIRTVLYYDLRVRKEGYDVELLAEQLGIEAAELPAGAISARSPSVNRAGRPTGHRPPAGNRSPSSPTFG